MSESYLETCKKKLIADRGWILDELTYAVINEKFAKWIGRVTTTHMRYTEEKETSFYVLTNGMNYVTIEESEIESLLMYCSSRYSEE